MWAKSSFRLLFLGALCLLAVAAFMTLGARGQWDFVIGFRGSKLLVMLLVAFCVAVSSVLFQAITQNNILTPSMMGFDSLYIFIQVLGFFLFSHSSLFGANPYVEFCLNTLAMAVAATVLFRWVAPKNASGLHLLLLMGIVFSLLFKGLSSFLIRMIDPNDFMLLQGMMFANFNSLHTQLIPLAILLSGLGSVLLWRARHEYDVVAMGQNMAVGLGVDYSRVVVSTLVGISILVSVSTALVGPVTFLGLLVSNLGYWVVNDHRHRLRLWAAFGCAVLCLVGGQTLLERVFALRFSISVIIEFFGGILFLILVLHRVKK